MHRLGRQFGKLDADAVRVGDVVQDRLRVAGADLGDVDAARLEHRGRLFHVLNVDAHVIDGGGTSRWK